MSTIKNAIEIKEMYLEQKRETTVSLSGISCERFNELLNGASATAEEIIGLSKALSQGVGDTFNMFNGDFACLSQENDLIKLLNGNDIEKLLNLYVLDRFVKIDGKLFFIFAGNVAKKLSDELARRIVKCFYNVGKIKIASSLSTESAHLSFDGATNVFDSKDKVLTYLFGTCKADSKNYVLRGWFEKAFNGCSDYVKDFLVENMAERYKAVQKIAESKQPDEKNAETDYIWITEGSFKSAYFLPRYEKLILSEKQKGILDKASKWLH